MLHLFEQQMPPLRALLKRVAPDQSVLENYEVELDFPHLGRRILLLNARKVIAAEGAGEERPLHRTADNVAEPINRLFEIVIEAPIAEAP